MKITNESIIKASNDQIMKMVKDTERLANNKELELDKAKFVEEIKSLQLSPFETAVYVHDFCSSFFYQGNIQFNLKLLKKLYQI